MLIILIAIMLMLYDFCIGIGMKIMRIQIMMMKKLKAITTILILAKNRSLKTKKKYLKLVKELQFAKRCIIIRCFVIAIAIERY